MMAEEKNLEFISAVHEYPLLYDPLHTDYKNLLQRNKIWGKVAEKCKLKNAKIAMKKWKHLKSYYKGILKREMSHPPGFKSSWYYKERMDLFREYFILAMTESNDPDELQEVVITHEKKSKNDDTLAVDYLIKRNEEEEKKEDDATDLFYRHANIVTRTLTKERQLAVKRKISDLLFKYQEEQYEEHKRSMLSIQMNSQPPSSSNFHFNIFQKSPYSHYVKPS